MADMKTTGGLDLAMLAVLGILMEGDRHPYDIAREVKVRHHEEPPGHTPRSLYHAVEKLCDLGLIEVVETIREGRRPERTVYRITEEGMEELRHGLVDLLINPNLGNRMFKAAVARLGYLTEGDALMGLGLRLANLRGLIAHQEATARILREQTRIPRLFLLEIELSTAQMRAEAAWVESVMDGIRQGEFDVEAEWIARMPHAVAGEGVALAMQGRDRPRGAGPTQQESVEDKR
ncbi:MAG: PadR family transcriptional regulator [Candidatus Dormibacteraeota bacterium]|nr:PadR family transcriptional regulator [Candidatus Dormibacteraeota bacterium]